MKKQIEEPKVVAAYVEPGKGINREMSETLREEQKRAEDQAKIDAIKQKSRNKVAELLEGKVWIREWTHPCLLHPDLKRQLSVSEFYPDKNIAIDKFLHFDEWELKLTDFKKEALNNAGFRYAALTPDKDWADIIVDLETQTVKETK